MASSVEDVFQVIRDFRAKDGAELWPADDLEVKRQTVELYFQRGLVTLLNDQDGRLAGFLFFYRDYQFKGLNVGQRFPAGPFVVCEFFWIREDCRNRVFARSLIEKCLRENREKLLGAEWLVYEDADNGFKTRIFDFGKFVRRYLWQRAEAVQHKNRQ